jgi:hypothetical protein
VLALATVVLLAALVYGAAGQVVSQPLLNPDELRYTRAAQEFVDGEWLNLRGHGYGYGALYPFLLAPILALSNDIEAAYPFFKIANALLFALAAVPIFLVARRLLSQWWSVAVAAMSVAIPSSIYTSLVMTESVSYLTCSLALLAVVLALERPSVARQLALVGAVGLAYAARAQFAALLLAFLAAYVLLWALDPQRPQPRAAFARLWPTLGAVALGVAAFAVRALLTSSSPAESLGGYGDLWRSYDLATVARFAVYHLAGLELYLFVVPFAVAPIVVSELVRAARRGSRPEGAFAAAFLTVNAVFVLIAAAFASTPFGWYELHERYLFYVAPLWLVVFAYWLSRGLPRPLPSTAIGIALALALPAVLPFGLIAGNVVIEVATSALWSGVWSLLDGYPLVDGKRVFVFVVVALALAAAAVPKRLWPVLPAVVLAGYVLTAGLAWQRMADAPSAFVRAEDTNRDWVDDALPDSSRTTKLVAASSCHSAELTRHALFLTEFFNISVDRAAALAGATPDGLPLDRVDVEPGGRLALRDGEPLVADYVVTQPEIELKGRKVAEGTGADLVLWKTDGPVRVTDIRRLAAAARNPDCS